jgi:hypothetical protein
MPVKIYRKLPVEIEAVQFTKQNDAENLRELVDFTSNKFIYIYPNDNFGPDIKAAVYDYLHDTWVGVKEGDYIIKGLKGEFYPHDEVLFPSAYEEVTDGLAHSA